MKILFTAKELSFYDDGSYGGFLPGSGLDTKHLSHWIAIEDVVYFKHDYTYKWKKCSELIQEAYRSYVLEQEILNLDENQKSETINSCGKK